MKRMLLHIVGLLLLGLLLYPMQSRAQVVISQVYGGGGNTGATYTHDFIELFNRGTTSVSLAGWSVQYTSATGTGNFGSSATLITELPSVTLSPGQYFLIQEAPGAGGTTALPSSDLVDSTPIAMAATGGKVALVNTTTPLGCNGSSTACSPVALATIVDLIGYGNANFFEGTGPTPAPSNTTAVLRANNGCTDTDDNASDFATGNPNPRNTSTAFNPCTPVDVAPFVNSTTPTNGATNVTTNSDILINFNEAVNVTGSWFSISGSTSGPHTATVSGGPTSFTLNPSLDFANNETVTVTIFAANVTDQDAMDPPDNMEADFAFSFATLASDLAPAVASTTPANGATGVNTNTTIAINFSEPVNVTGSWFSISGATSGPHTATVTGGPQNFTLDPDLDFVNNETVTVTVVAANITDQDATDPPDNMEANFEFSFVTPSLIINEILADPSATNGDANNDGTINTTQDEFIEFINVTGGPLNISGWTLSDAVQVRHTFPAGTMVAAQCGIVLFAGGSPTGSFGNVMVQVASTGQLGLNNTGDTVTLRNGATVVATYTYGNEGNFNQSLTRNPDITGPAPLVQHTTATGASGRLHSPGVKVDGAQFSGCPPLITKKEIFEIQGSGLTSAFANQSVTTENNVVTAVGANGFFIQTPSTRSDNDAQTSDGIFVFTSSAPAVNIGDWVNVSGDVVEFFNFTEFSNGPSVTLVSSGNPLPAPVQFDTMTPSPNQPQAATEYERFEGMRVEITNGVVAGPNQTFGTDPLAEVFIVAGPNRPFREPGIEFPGLPGLPVWDGNPEIFEFDPDRLGQPNLAIPAGSTFSATGVLGFEFSGYEFWPTQYSINAAMLPRPVRARNPGESTVATLNLHLLYDTINDPGGDDVATSLEYATKLNKLSLYIRTLLGAPDILAVQEAEKLAVLQDLANKINADNASLTYTPYLLEGNDVGGIDVGFLVRNTVTVNSVTQFGKTDIFTFDGSLLHDRPPLLLDANLAHGTAISVLCVHQRSLNGIDDPADGNRVRLKRHTQADSVARIVQRLQNSKPFINLVVTGDFNAFQFTDGYVDVLGQIMGTPSDASRALIPGTDQVNPDLINKVLALPAAEQYSFNFNGSAQVLDHTLVSQTLNPAITEVAYARGNSDAAENLESDGTTPLRASDHDGLVLYVMPIPVNADAGADQEICLGQSTAIGGAPTGSGGTGALTFSWTPVNGLNDPSAANPMASPTATTTYMVTVTDANNSKATDQVTVTVNPRPAINAGADRTIFVGQSVALGAKPTATGGTPPYSFNWTPTAGLNNPAAANPNARPVVTTKYFVNVTDAKGCSNLDSVTITVRDEVFLAQEYIHFHGPRASEGNMHANGSINFHIGRPSVIKGNLEAVEDILIRAKNTIDGNVTAGNHVSLIGNAKVTGAVNIAPVPSVPFPAMTFIAGGKNITVGSKQTLTLPPGSYGEVKVLSGGKLSLASGQYFMRKFEMNSSTQLAVDVSTGPATINIVGNFKFGKKAKVVITPTGTMASAQVGFIARTSAGIEIGEQAVVRGAIIAPNAMVTLQEDCQFKGSIGAEKIDVHSGARFFPHGSTSLLKSDGLDDAFAANESEVASEPSPVTSYQLEQNYPNPFNPSTKIQFSVVEAGDVQLAIYNLQGQEIRTLISGQMEAGRHAIMWNGRDNTGKLAPSGVYLYKLRVNGFEETRKMTLMK